MQLAASGATLSAATAVCDEAKRVGSVGEMWDVAYKALATGV